jgi:glyoxylase-like metal-dependent hydrolase (beta-lactamase superfamily II)
MIAEVVPGVFSIRHQVADGKNVVVFGRRGALAIDSGTHEEEGRVMADLIRQKGYQPHRLALTHGHGDHLLGARPLAEGEVYAHAQAPAVIRRQVPGWAERQKKSAEQIISELVWPTITYRDELRIDLGGKTVWFFPTPGHSEDGVSALVEEDRLLISGDAVVTGIVAAIGDGDSRILEQSLRKLLAMQIEVLIPGHGPELHGAGKVAEWIAWEADYLARVRSFVRPRLEKGQEPEAVIEAVGFGKFIGDRLRADQHGMPGRHRNTVRKIVEEELEALRRS